MRSFFFQAEDGIRDLYVTGVQTCALPISPSGQCRPAFCEHTASAAGCFRQDGTARMEKDYDLFERTQDGSLAWRGSEIGRASCRERVKAWVVVGASAAENKRVCGAARAVS